MLNELCFELVPQKSPRERGLESKAVDVKCANAFRFITNFMAGCIFHQKWPKSNGESKAVETRQSLATLSCSVHKPAWKRATARCPGSAKTYAQAP